MKKAFKIGAITGGILGFSVAVGMDLIMGGTISSNGWADAVANDLNLLFGTSFQSSDFIVMICAFIAIGIMVIISALLGGIFSAFLAGFFNFMTKKGEWNNLFLTKKAGSCYKHEPEGTTKDRPFL